MEHLNQEPSQDTFEVEISDLSTGEPGEPVERHPSTRLTSRARLSRRAHARRILLEALAFLLMVGVILGSQPTVRNQVVHLVQRFIPTPTPTLVPGADRFYIATDVPWTIVTLDGQPIRLPRIGEEVPLQLARGRHVLAWTAAPFQPQRCSLTVPPTPAASCPLIDEVRHGAAGGPAFVIGLHESLDTLPVPQQQALIQAAQAALVGFSDSVQPGEPYVLLASGEPVPNAFGTGIATQPLRATLHLELDPTATGGSCTLSLLSQTPQNCSIAGQNCARWCAVPWQTRQAAPPTLAQQAWVTLAVLAPASWTYTTPEGRTIAQNQPLGPAGIAWSETPILLRIAWDGQAWQVQPLFGPEQGPPIVVDGSQVTDDIACLIAEDLFPADSATYAQLRFISGSNPAAGCLIEATLATQAETPTPASAQVEEYLVRFGEFVAVNSLAQQRTPQWPLADVYEKQLARQLAALPGGVSVTLVP